jgi:hypothetical protein
VPRFGPEVSLRASGRAARDGTSPVRDAILLVAHWVYRPFLSVFLPPSTPKNQISGSMTSRVNPMAISSLREGPPTRRELTLDTPHVFDRGALRASARSLSSPLFRSST